MAVLDDYNPTAVDERLESLVVFFPSPTLRNQAHAALGLAMPQAHLTDLDVDDEDWARRSQANLPPVVVGTLTIVSEIDDLGTTPRRVVIRPSMGFGTGHHATTRLCLAALQTLDLTGSFVLDVGTGSGILALAARRLGARAALGVDCDADAIRSAAENLLLNPDLTEVRFAVSDLDVTPLPTADVVTANLTGALLRRAARVLSRAVSRGGHVIVSGLLDCERNQVRQALEDQALGLVWERTEQEWTGLGFRRLAETLVSSESPDDGRR